MDLKYFDYCTCMGGFKLLILFSFLFPLPIQHFYAIIRTFSFLFFIWKFGLLADHFITFKIDVMCVVKKKTLSNYIYH